MDWIFIGLGGLFWLATMALAQGCARLSRQRERS